MMDASMDALEETKSLTETILVVDDNPANLGVVSEYLKEYGYRILIARDGESALEKAGIGQPDLILLDVMMPGMDGFETCRRLKDSDALRDIPVIFMTALTDTIDKVKGFQAGGVDYVTKPLSYDEVLVRIKTHLSLYALKRQLTRQNEQLHLEIEGHRIAAEALRRSEEKFRMLVENINEVHFTLDGEGRIQYVSPSIERFANYMVPEFIGKPFSLFVHPEDLPDFQNCVQGTMGGAWEEADVRVITKGGDVLFVHSSISPLWNGEQVVGINGLMTDITARKQAEAELQKAHAELERRVEERTMDLSLTNEKLRLEILERLRVENIVREREQHIQRQLEQLTALREIDTAIAGSTDLRLTLKAILRSIMDQLQVDAADILLFNSYLNVLEYADGLGFRSRALQHTQLSLGEGYAGQAALNRGTIHIPDLSSAMGDLRRSRSLPDEGFVAYFAVPLIGKGRVKGVLELFLRSPNQPNKEWLDFMETLAGQAAIAIENASLFHDLQQSNIELTQAYDATIEGWSRALDLRDSSTEGHTQRVTEMALKLARTMGVSEGDLIHLRRGAMLHDIGKMGIPDHILNKPGPLTDEEYEIIRQHPEHAYAMLKPIDFLRPALEIPYGHHEHWDGSGYPNHLKGEQIPLAARVFSVVDVWDALISDRPYHAAWEEEQAKQFLLHQSGKYFDPKIVEIFFQIWHGTRQP